jgi:Zn-dependent metalloprotease
MSLLALPPAAGAADLREAASVRATGEAEARAWGAHIDALLARGDLVLARDQDDPDFPARRHLRYEQRVGGRRVFGAEVVRQIDGLGHTLTVFGRLHEGLGDGGPLSLTADQAGLAAELAMGRPARVVGVPELVVLPLAGRTALAWMLWARLDQRLERFLVDARTGEIALRYDDLHTTAAVGVGTGVWGDRKKVSADAVGGAYRADDQLRPPALTTYDLVYDGGLGSYAFATGSIDPFWIARSADNNWTDGAVVDAHVYAGYTYDYYFKRHGRRGLDGQDQPMRSVVHFLPLASGYANAFWDTFHASVFYGDGDGQFASFSSALDVVAHELTHGVTQYTWNGLYFGESGALNEAFSDIMGTAAEFFHQPPGNARRQADYYLGEDLARVFNPPVTAVRSMENPALFCFSPTIGCDADHRTRLYRGSEDNGGVHHNNGLANQAFYLLVEGGVNRTSGLHVQGLGAASREKAEKIFYRGFTAYLTPAAAFSDARAATIQAARDLYGPSSIEAATVAAAWTAVGVE